MCIINFLRIQVGLQKKKMGQRQNFGDCISPTLPNEMFTTSNKGLSSHIICLYQFITYVEDSTNVITTICNNMSFFLN